MNHHTGADPENSWSRGRGEGSQNVLASKIVTLYFTENSLKLIQLKTSKKMGEGGSAALFSGAPLNPPMPMINLPTCRRLLFPLLHAERGFSACNKGNRRRLHAGKWSTSNLCLLRRQWLGLGGFVSVKGLGGVSKGLDVIERNMGVKRRHSADFRPH